MRCSLAAALFVYCLSVAAAERLSGSGRTRTTRTVYPERLPYGSKPRWPRSLPGEDSGGLNASSGPRSELYRLDRGLTLALVPDSRHLSPTLVTLRFGEDSLPDGRTLVPDTEDLGHCYYTGHVLGQRDSRAVVSLCDGMTGYIQTATQGLLTIEPVRRGDGVRDKDGSRSPHLLTLHQVGPDVDAAPSLPASSRNATTGATWRKPAQLETSFDVSHLLKRTTACNCASRISVRPCQALDSPSHLFNRLSFAPFPPFRSNTVVGRALVCVLTKVLTSLSSVHNHVETADWHVGKEAPCPVSCGGGVTQRNVTCRSSSGAVVDSVHCRGSPQPPTTVDCNLAPCPPPQRQPSPVPLPERTNGVTSASLPFPEQATQSASSTYAVWRSAPWSQCSVSCGSGLIKRQVSCVHEVTGGLLPNEDCNGRGPKPVTAEACDGGPCGHWQHGDWGACSVSCGQGIATRRVRCLASSPSQEHLPDDRCEESSRPRSEQACQVPCGAGGIMSDGASAMHHPSGNFVEGPYKWRIGLWGTCSKSCGGGVQRRQVVCVDNLDSKSHACNPQLRPPETQHCNTDECPVWAMGEWTQCDQECGGGHQTRQVACQGRMGLPLMDAHCPQPRPESRRSCNSHSCASPLLSHRWHSGSWSPCSVTCGTGVMKRKIECLDSSHNAAPYIKCEGDPPEHAKTCTMEECPKWQLSPWSPCTAPCGNGTQKRVARCMKRGQEVSPLNCHGKRPSPQVRTCNLRPCHYRWKKKRWTPCSATCGGGSQTRTVVCVDRSERLAPERFCNSQRRPKVVRHCAVHPCPFIWKTSDWSECSQTCGEGFQKRAVTCHKVNPYGWADPRPRHNAQRRHDDAAPHNKRAAHYCTPHDRPATTRPCMVGHCGDGVFWRPGPWTPCSTSDGPRKQKRQRTDHDNTGKRVNNSHCSAALKHRIKRKRRCMLRPCSAVSCEEVQRRGGVHTDGEQQLNIRGRQVKVYCARMNTSSPKEYISLDSGESNNYSEVYGKRLIQSDECPYGGARVDNCDCVDYPAALTTFSKVAFNITSLEVNRHDFTFSRTQKGRPTGFGESGDCYSRAKCPQGRFSLNLAGTDFVVADATKWVTQGPHAVIKLRRLQEGQIIQGQCGGYCGTCFPDPTRGLLLDVRPP
uniref:Putative thrombospondin-like protein n=1 Tax=Ixodes scapularis TaxID=6945 RepID=A0A4D5S4Z2_IXOSC